MRELIYGRYCGPFWAIAGAVTLIAPPAGCTIIGGAIGLFLLSQAVKGVSFGVGKGVHNVVDSVERGWKSVKPERIIVHTIPDHRADDLKELDRRYQERVDLIQKSRLDPDAKKRMLDDLQKWYEDYITRLLQ